jgi:hypothetical protein
VVREAYCVGELIGCFLIFSFTDSQGIWPAGWGGLGGKTGKIRGFWRLFMSSGRILSFCINRSLSGLALLCGRGVHLLGHPYLFRAIDEAMDGKLCD